MKMTGSGMVCHQHPGGPSRVSSWTTASPVYKISSPHQQSENRKPDKLTITVSPVIFHVIHAHTLIYITLGLCHTQFRQPILVSLECVCSDLQMLLSCQDALSLGIFDAGTIQYFRVLVTGSLLFVSLLCHMF